MKSKAAYIRFLRMRMISLAFYGCTIFFVVGCIKILLLWILHPDWWRKRPVRIAAIVLPLIGMVFVVSWAGGIHYSLALFTRLGAIIAPSVLIIEMALIGSLVISGMVHTIVRITSFIGQKAKKAPVPVSPARRDFIKTAAAAIPAAAVATSFVGIADSYAEIIVPERHVPVANLPGSLLGFKIAQLSDSHLGWYVHLDHIEDVVAKIMPHSPDLVLYTGDISDDLAVLPRTLEIVSRLNPPYGIYACVGNHEYYRGIRDVLRIFQKAPFPILINQHINIPVGDTMIYLGGADDPRSLQQDHSAFLRGTIDLTMADAPEDYFKLLMCHRPEGFEYAAVKGIDLILSGHTHGGQIAIGGKSLMGAIFPRKYPWGIYRKDRTTLHTSGGMGHWFPFRLGVPPEAPMLILERAQST